MFLILSTINAKQQLNSIYNDYDLAYLGKEFSEAFKAWNYDFHHGMTPILYGAFTSILPSGSYQYAYDECTITYTSYVLRGNIYVAVIQDYRFNRELLEDVREETQIERTRIGIGSNTATTTVSRLNVNDYTEQKDYGFLFGNQVVLIKRKGVKPNKRQLFNYKLYPKNGGTPYIMYDQDFYSANPFEDNIATAWGTDGHKYELYSRRRMRMIENKKHIEQIISEVINQYLKQNLILN